MKILGIFVTLMLVLVSCKSVSEPLPEVVNTQDSDTVTSISTPTLKPASFQVSALTITPSEVNTNSPVTIEVTVSNIGELSGSYDVNLKIDGNLEGTETVTLAGGASQRVTFTKSESKAKTYTVNVDNQSGTFTVMLPPTLLIPPAPEELAKQNFDLPELPRILCEQLKQMMDNGDDFVLVDARLNSTFTFGYISGAINIPYDDSSPTYTQEWVNNQLKALPQNKMIIFYCA